MNARKPEDSGEAVVFVRGTGRCGSKTLVSQLGQHPDLDRVPINQTLPEQLIEWSRYALDPTVPERAIALACRAYFSAYGRCLGRGSGTLLHKSTMNVHLLETVLRFWPEARIVYMVRHPIEVVEAFVTVDLLDHDAFYGYDTIFAPHQRGIESFPVTVANSLLRWYNDVRTYLRSGVCHHPRLLQVRFEDMIEQPDRTFENIYRFLKLEPREHTLPGPDHYDRPQFYLNEEERRWIIEATSDVLPALGYEPQRWSAEVPRRHRGLLGLYPERRLRSRPPAPDAVELVRQAVDRAVDMGYTRIGLFGAGYLAHLVAPYLQDTAAEVLVLLDDNPLLINKQCGDLPIRRPEAAPDWELQAVIPLSLVHQGKLANRWRRLMGHQMVIVPLWDEEDHGLPGSAPVGGSSHERTQTATARESS